MVACELLKSIQNPRSLARWWLLGRELLVYLMPSLSVSSPNSPTQREESKRVAACFQLETRQLSLLLAEFHSRLRSRRKESAAFVPVPLLTLLPCAVSLTSITFFFIALTTYMSPSNNQALINYNILLTTFSADMVYV